MWPNACPSKGSSPLRDANEFAAVRVNPELGTVYWPSGADLDPDVLYALVTGEGLSSLEPPVKSQ